MSSKTSFQIYSALPSCVAFTENHVQSIETDITERKKEKKGVCESEDGESNRREVFF